MATVSGLAYRRVIPIRRLSLGNPGDVRPVGEGVCELRIDYGPGYRAYYVVRGEKLVILSGARTLEMPKARTRQWDVAEHLKSDADMVAYLEAALEDGDPSLVAAALGDIARARGMSDVAKETGLGRESLY